MSSNKQPGTLRDFNISGQFQGSTSVTGQRVANSNPAPKTAPAAVPNQSVKSRAIPARSAPVATTTPRKPNLTEWEDPDQFWSSWEKDLESPDPVRRPQPQMPTAKPAAPVAVKSVTAQSAQQQQQRPQPAQQKTPVAQAPKAKVQSITQPVQAQPVRTVQQPAVQANTAMVARTTQPTRAMVASAPIDVPAPALSNLNDTRNAHAPVEMSDMQGELQSEDAGSTPWAVEIAVQERRAERMGVVDFANAYQKQELLKKMTLEFMASLRKVFQEQIEVFNESRRNPAQNIQLYRVSNTAEDFMIFRNSVKLVVSGQRAGRIVFGFNQFLGQIFTPRTPNTFEIEASWGAFDQLAWNYRNERVQGDEIVRYFLTEFSRQSFR